MTTPLPSRAGAGRLRSAVRRVVIGLPWLIPAIALWPSRPYPVDVASQFALHAVLPLLGLSLLLLALRWRPAAISCGLAAACLLVLFRMNTTPPRWAATPDRGATRIRIVHFNAYAGASRHDEGFAGWLRQTDPDIAVIVDSPWRYVDAQPWTKERYPYRIDPDPSFRWPMTILSKFPLAPAAELGAFEGTESEMDRSFAANRAPVVQLPSGSRFLLSAMHPPSPRKERSWSLSLQVAQREAKMLRTWARSSGLPVVVTGDFNSTPTGRLHHVFGAASGFVAWTPWMRAGTWPSSLSPWWSISIDRVWTTPDVVVRSVVVGPQFASDHRPIEAVVDVPGAKERADGQGK